MKDPGPQEAKLTALPTGNNKTAVVAKMFDSIAGRYEAINRIVTFGIDKRWRLQTVRHMSLKPQATVVDLAAGTGDFCRMLQQANVAPIAIDLSAGMLKVAVNKQTPENSYPVLQADAAHLPIADKSIDGITCGFGIRNFSDLESCFAEMARVCRPGARIGLLEACEPRGTLFKTLHKVWMHWTVPKIGAILSSAFAYDYLPKSLAYLPPGDELIAMLERAGFVDVEIRLLTFQAAQLLTATKK